MRATFDFWAKFFVANDPREIFFGLPPSKDTYKK